MEASEITKMKATFNVKNNLIFFIISLVVLNIINLKYCFTFYVNSVTILLLLFVLIGIIFLISASIGISSYSKFSISSYMGTLSSACIITVYSGSGITKYQADLSKEKASVIIKALHNCEQARNEYPEDLSELIPEFLESKPNSSMGWFNEPFNISREMMEVLILLFQVMGEVIILRVHI